MAQVAHPPQRYHEKIEGFAGDELRKKRHARGDIVGGGVRFVRHPSDHVVKGVENCLCCKRSPVWQNAS